MRITTFLLPVIVGATLLLSCCSLKSTPAGKQITVASAANLTGVLDEIGASFTKESGIKVVLSYGSTAQLSQQIEKSAPFDVFAAADIEHVDSLVRKQFILPESRAIYARGVVALWIPKGDSIGVRTIGDLSRPTVRVISVANPKLAPYGQATVEALQNLGVWRSIEPKIVYANNISMAMQYAASGNADAAFTAYSLVHQQGGRIVLVNQSLHSPVDQAVGVVTASKNLPEARRFTAFLLSEASKSILKKHGYITTGL